MEYKLTALVLVLLCIRFTIAAVTHEYENGHELTKKFTNKYKKKLGILK